MKIIIMIATTIIANLIILIIGFSLGRTHPKIIYTSDNEIIREIPQYSEVWIHYDNTNEYLPPWKVEIKNSENHDGYSKSFAKAWDLAVEKYDEYVEKLCSRRNK